MEDTLYLDLKNGKGCNKIKFRIFYTYKAYLLTVALVNIDGMVESCDIFRDSFRLTLNSVGRKSKGGYKKAFAMLGEMYGEIRSKYISQLGDVEFDDEKVREWINLNAG